MIDYRIVSLYSGSSGNSFLISTPHANVLIDAGRNVKTLTAALREIGLGIEDIDAIFITHDHRDHTAALPVLLKRHNIPVHAVEASAQVISFDLCEAARENLCRHTPIYTETVGNITVRSFITPHDSEFSVGYRIEICEGEESVAIGYATDLGDVTEDVRAALMGCESVVLESNHDREMLLSGPYPLQLKERIRSRYGHLPNDDCAALAAELCEHGMKHLMLAHLSEENNAPEIAYNETLMALGGASVTLAVAAPDAVVELPLDGAEVREGC
jgi:phosphoribosyl 1,2-cyclic phosphodiesterase